MAKILSPVWSVIRGSIGGTTYTANQFHQIIARSRTAPVNPGTAKQTAIRSALSGAAASWNLASQLLRDAWDDYAASLTFQGPLGPYSVPGREVFIANISVALYLQGQVGSPAVVGLGAPINPGFLDIENVIPVAFAPPASTGVSLGFTQNGPEDVIGYAQVSRMFNPSRNRFKGPMLSATLTDVTVVAPGSGVIDFAGLIVDQKYFMNPRFVSALAPFRLSARFYLDAIAITNI